MQRPWVDPLGQTLMQPYPRPTRSPLMQPSLAVIGQTPPDRVVQQPWIESLHTAHRWLLESHQPNPDPHPVNDQRPEETMEAIASLRHSDCLEEFQESVHSLANPVHGEHLQDRD